MIEMNEVAAQRPNLIGIDNNDETIAKTDFVLEHLRTKQAVLSTMI